MISFGVSAQKSLPSQRRQRVEVEQRQEINRLELTIQRGRAANVCTECEISTEQFWNLRRLARELAKRTIVGREWTGSPWRLRQMLAAQVGIRRRPDCRVLGRDGTASEKKAPTVLSRVSGDAFPEQAKDDKVAMLRMDTRAPQLNHFRAQRLEGLELEFLRAVISYMRRRIVAGLQSVCADDIGGGQMFNDEMIANGIKGVFVQAGRVGLFKSFVEFEIENLKPQRLCRANVIPASRQPGRVVSG